jgi:hypothetical protein
MEFGIGASRPVWGCLFLLLVVGWPLPAALLADVTRGKMAAWRRWVIVLEDTMLGLVQVAAIIILLATKP